MTSIDQLIDQLTQSTIPAGQDTILKLQQLYQQICQIDHSQQKSVFERISQTNIVNLLINTSKQDFVQPQGKWKSACQISCFVVQLCKVMLLDLGTHLTRQDLVQELLESQLVQLRRIQKCYAQPPNQKQNADLLEAMSQILQNIRMIIDQSEQLTVELVRSSWFLQLFVADQEDMSLLFIRSLTEMMKQWPSMFGKLTYGHKVDLLDELMYQIAVQDGANAMVCTLECLVTITETTPDIRLILLKRYHGIQLLLSKWATQFLTRFKSSGLQVDEQTKLKNMITHLIDYIGPYRSKSSMDLATDVLDKDDEVCEKHVLTENQAAVVIQSQWRGYLERSKLKRINQAFAVFQHQFRERQSARTKSAREQRMQAQLALFVQTQRHQRHRERLEAEAKLWESLPPVLFRKQVENQKQEAALCIQKFFRGYRVRSMLRQTWADQKRNQAARLIQRAFRKYLSRKECLSTTRPGPIGDSKSGDDQTAGQIDILEARKKHRGWCETQLQSTKMISDDDLGKLHHDLQIRLHQYYRAEIRRQNEDQTREASLARCQMNAELLLTELNEPLQQPIAKSTNPDSILTGPIKTSLAHAVNRHETNSTNQKGFDKFFCRVQPLARLAQAEHRECLLGLEKPWWESTMRQYRKKLHEWCQAHEAHVTTDKPGMQQDPAELDEALHWLPDNLINQIEYVDEFLYKNKV